MNSEYIYQIIPWIQNNFIDLLNTILVGFGVWIAYQGLTTWKKQLRGQDEYKLAIEIMECVYDLGERLSYARGRLYSYSQDDIKDSQAQNTLHYQKHAERVNHMLEANNQLRVLKLRADALWGKSYTQELDEILKLIKQFTIDFENFYQFGWDEPKNRKDNKDAEEMWIIMHGSFNGKPDKFGDDFSTAISKIEEKMRNNIILTK